MAHKFHLTAVAALITLASCSSNNSNQSAAGRDTVQRKPITQSTSPGTDNGSTNQNGTSTQSAPANAAPNTPSTPAATPTGTGN